MPEQRQKTHEPSGREARKLPAEQTRNFGLIDLQDARRPSLREPLRPNRRSNSNRKVCFRQPPNSKWDDWEAGTQG